MLHPFTDLEINSSFSSSHLYCYIPYVSFKAMVAYMKCKRFQIQRRLFLLQTSELSDWYFCVLGIVCWNRWYCVLEQMKMTTKNQLISDVPVHQRTSFDMGLITLKTCLVILFTLKELVLIFRYIKA